MLYIRGEGQKMRNGLNFYPLSDWKYSRGFVFKWNGYLKMFRYSVKLKTWIFASYNHADYKDTIVAEKTTIIDIPRKR